MQDTKTKKADVAEYPKEFRHVGLLGNKPTGRDRFALYLVIRSLIEPKESVRRVRIARAQSLGLLLL